MVFELLQSRLKRLNLKIKQLKLSLVGTDLSRILIIHNANLITVDQESLFDRSEISGNRFRTTLFTPINLVNPGHDYDEAGHCKNGGKPQSYVSAVHIILSHDFPHLSR